MVLTCIYMTSEVRSSLMQQHRPHFITLVCKNCSIYGSIEIFSGSLSTNLSDSSDSWVAAAEFWEKGGFVELLVNDFFAHIELETKDLHGSLSAYRLSAFSGMSLEAIRISTLTSCFQIEGIAAVGPQLLPQASMGVQIGATLTFTYGFEVHVSSKDADTSEHSYH
jgi:hypothetical protein